MSDKEIDIEVSNETEKILIKETEKMFAEIFRKALKPLGIRLEALEKHDIFKVWTSIRKGGKTTLEALLNNNRGIKDLQEQIAELKAIEKVTLDTIEVISKDYKGVKEVLRELIEESYVVIHALFNSKTEIGLKKDSRLWAILNGFVKILDNLNRKLDVGSARQTERMTKREYSCKFESETEKKVSPDAASGVDKKNTNAHAACAFEKKNEVRDRMERFKLGMTKKEYEKFKKGENWIKDLGGEKEVLDGYFENLSQIKSLREPNSKLPESYYVPDGYADSKLPELDCSGCKFFNIKKCPNGCTGDTMTAYEPKEKPSMTCGDGPEPEQEKSEYQLRFKDIIIDVIDIMGYTKDDGEVKEIREYLESIDNEYVLTRLK